MCATHQRKTLCLLKKIICSFLSLSFITTMILPPTYAQQVMSLPTPGQMVWLSSGYEPIVLKGLTTHVENPFLFDFIVDRGETKANAAELKTEGEKLVKYFLASLTIPDQDAWVNLSPYEKDRIIPQALGTTEMGQQMLEQDYILKQLSASLTNPEKDLGKKFWDEVAKRSAQDVPRSTFNKVWITSGGATVVEKDGFAYITKSHLKVMLEEDYVSESGKRKENSGDKNSLEAFRQVILPQLEKEVNEGKNFAPIRQVYHAVILATWFKKALKESLLGKVYADQSKIAGVNTAQKDFQTQVYQQYLEAFKKGAYNLIKEETNAATDEVIPRKYFSGGVTNLGSVSSVVVDRTSTAVRSVGNTLAEGIRTGSSTVLTAQFAETRAEANQALSEQQARATFINLTQSQDPRDLKAALAFLSLGREASVTDESLLKYLTELGLLNRNLQLTDNTQVIARTFQSNAFTIQQKLDALKSTTATSSSGTLTQQQVDAAFAKVQTVVDGIASLYPNQGDVLNVSVRALKAKTGLKQEEVKHIFRFLRLRQWDLQNPDLWEPESEIKTRAGWEKALKDKNNQVLNSAGKVIPINAEIVIKAIGMIYKITTYYKFSDKLDFPMMSVAEALRNSEVKGLNYERDGFAVIQALRFFGFEISGYDGQFFLRFEGTLDNFQKSLQARGLQVSSSGITKEAVSDLFLKVNKVVQTLKKSPQAYWNINILQDQTQIPTSELRIILNYLGLSHNGNEYFAPSSLSDDSSRKFLSTEQWFKNLSELSNPPILNKAGQVRPIPHNVFEATLAMIRQQLEIEQPGLKSKRLGFNLTQLEEYIDEGRFAGLSQENAFYVREVMTLLGFDFRTVGGNSLESEWDDGSAIIMAEFSGTSEQFEQSLVTRGLVSSSGIVEALRTELYNLNKVYREINYFENSTDTSIDLADLSSSTGISLENLKLYLAYLQFKPNFIGEDSATFDKPKYGYRKDGQLQPLSVWKTEILNPSLGIFDGDQKLRSFNPEVFAAVLGMINRQPSMVSEKVSIYKAQLEAYSKSGLPGIQPQDLGEAFQIMRFLGFNLSRGLFQFPGTRAVYHQSLQNRGLPTDLGVNEQAPQLILNLTPNHDEVLVAQALIPPAGVTDAFRESVAALVQYAESQYPLVDINRNLKVREIRLRSSSESEMKYYYGILYVPGIDLKAVLAKMKSNVYKISLQSSSLPAQAGQLLRTLAQNPELKDLQELLSNPQGNMQQNRHIREIVSRFIEQALKGGISEYKDEQFIVLADNIKSQSRESKDQIQANYQMLGITYRNGEYDEKGLRIFMTLVFEAKANVLASSGIEEKDIRVKVNEIISLLPAEIKDNLTEQSRKHVQSVLFVLLSRAVDRINRGEASKQSYDDIAQEIQFVWDTFLTQVPESEWLTKAQLSQVILKDLGLEDAKEAQHLNDERTVAFMQKINQAAYDLTSNFNWQFNEAAIQAALSAQKLNVNSREVIALLRYITNPENQIYDPTTSPMPLSIDADQLQKGFQGQVDTMLNFLGLSIGSFGVVHGQVRLDMKGQDNPSEPSKILYQHSGTRAEYWENIKSRGFIQQPDTAVNASSAASPVGGIDFDPSKLDLQIKRDGRGVPLPLPQQDLEHIHIQGLYPMIINIQPMTTVPAVLGLKPEDLKKTEQLAQG